jgi:hypothetical protein
MCKLTVDYIEAASSKSIERRLAAELVVQSASKRPAP